MANNLKEVVLLSFMTTVLFIQQIALSAIPNIQFSFLLVVVYTKAFGTRNTMMITLLHVFANVLIYGGYMYVIAPFMVLGYWSVIAIVQVTPRSKKNYNIRLAVAGFIGSLTYSWILAIPSIFILGLNWKLYLAADLVWELVLGLSSFITILFLFEPLEKVLKNYKERK